MSAFANKILLATDGSPDAESAARMSITLSNGLNLELHVVCMGRAPSVYTQPVVRRVRQGDMHYSSLRILPANRPISEARPAGFEPATRALEVRDEPISGNSLKRGERLSKPNPTCPRLLAVSACLLGLESG